MGMRSKPRKSKKNRKRMAARILSMKDLLKREEQRYRKKVRADKLMEKSKKEIGKLLKDGKKYKFDSIVKIFEKNI